MGTLSRRSVLRASLGLAAAGSLARPYIANAQAKTATVWWTQGFVPEEDDAFRKVVADYENVSGNKIEFSRHFGPNILEQQAIHKASTTVQTISHSTTSHADRSRTRIRQALTAHPS